MPLHFAVTSEYMMPLHFAANFIIHDAITFCLQTSEYMMPLNFANFRIHDATTFCRNFRIHDDVVTLLLGPPKLVSKNCKFLRFFRCQTLKKTLHKFWQNIAFISVGHFYLLSYVTLICYTDRKGILCPVAAAKFGF